MPPELADRALGIAEGRLSPAVPRDAATVILLRPGSSGFGDPGAGVDTDPGVEAFLLVRTAILDFAPGACVFPGGSVDDRDADPEVGWAGPAPAAIGDLLDVPPERARALICAAIRETFEESGVLLAGPSPGDLVQDSAELARDRHALLAGSVTFNEVLRRHQLLLRADLLTPWARWITPEASPRRFDTWFFAAAVPPGQTAAVPSPAEQDQTGRERPGESESGTWLEPAAALAAARAGEITLLPPTAATLGELAAYPDVASIVARRRPIVPRLPEVVIENGRARLHLPPAGEEQS
ncbi:MAG: NUDIX hydrolase [Streptosporangiaceae bacterium]